MSEKRNYHKESGYAAQSKYRKKNYVTVSIVVPKEKIDIVKELSNQESMSMPALFVSAFEKEYGIQLRKNSPNFKSDDQV